MIIARGGGYGWWLVGQETHKCTGCPAILPLLPPRDTVVVVVVIVVAVIAVAMVITVVVVVVVVVVVLALLYGACA